MSSPDFDLPIPSANQAGSFDQERERMHRQMLSSVSHDLKTPLASIIGSLEIYERMKDKLPQERQQTLIRVALQEAYRLDVFITNILDMAKLESGMIKPQRENSEIGAIVKNCMQRLDHHLHNCTMEVDTSSTAVEAVIDPVLLHRAINVVLDNAVKYGGIPPVINIQWGKTDDQQGFVRICDNGQGIPESRREVIFSKYTRFAKEDQQSAGTGLGLAIGREIMHLLGGDITVAQRSEGGTVFTLNFPLA